MKRPEFSEKTKRLVHARQGERCFDCKQPTPRRKGRFDHHVTCFDGGGNDPGNCRFLCIGCDKRKTYGTHVPLSGDLSKIAKTKRLVEAATLFEQRLRAKRTGRRRKRRSKIRSRKRDWPKRSFEQRRSP